ncbi:hypothetical protein PTL465_16980 [Ligilactobacillus agilis]|nr:hypothetical protein PTL465_16980 [Ligilactobacillus agilis]
MTLENKVMLITYPDSLGKNIKELTEVLTDDFGEAIGGGSFTAVFPINRGPRVCAG